MPLYGTFVESEWAHLEDGTYLMRCTGVEEAEIENSLYDPRIYRLSLRPQTTSTTRTSPSGWTLSPAAGSPRTAR